MVCNQLNHLKLFKNITFILRISVRILCLRIQLLITFQKVDIQEIIKYRFYEALRESLYCRLINSANINFIKYSI